MLIVGLLAPLAVRIVPCPGVLNDSVPKFSLSTTLLSVPPTINDVACKLPSFLRFVTLVFSFS